MNHLSAVARCDGLGSVTEAGLSLGGRYTSVGAPNPGQRSHGEIVRGEKAAGAYQNLTAVQH